MKTLLLATIVAASLAPPSASLGQQVDVTTGDRVRIRRMTGSTVTGRLEASLTTELRVFSEGMRREYMIPRTAIVSIERSVGRQRRFARNFGLTVAAGAVAGGIIGAATYTPCESTGLMSCFITPDDRAQAAGFGVLAGGMIAIPIGVIFGLTARHDHWEPVDQVSGADLQAVIAPARGHVQIRAVLRW